MISRVVQFFATGHPWNSRLVMRGSYISVLFLLVRRAYQDTCSFVTLVWIANLDSYKQRNKPMAHRRLQITCFPHRLNFHTLQLH